MNNVKRNENLKFVIRKVCLRIKLKVEIDPNFKNFFGDLSTFDGLKKFRDTLDPHTGKKYSLRDYSINLGLTSYEACQFDEIFSLDKEEIPSGVIQSLEEIGIRFGVGLAYCQPFFNEFF